MNCTFGKVNSIAGGEFCGRESLLNDVAFWITVEIWICFAITKPHKFIWGTHAIMNRCSRMILYAMSPSVLMQAKSEVYSPSVSPSSRTLQRISCTPPHTYRLFASHRFALIFISYVAFTDIQLKFQLYFDIMFFEHSLTSSCLFSRYKFMASMLLFYPLA